MKKSISVSVSLLFLITGCSTTTHQAEGRISLSRGIITVSKEDPVVLRATQTVLGQAKTCANQVGTVVYEQRTSMFKRTTLEARSVSCP